MSDQGFMQLVRSWSQERQDEWDERAAIIEEGDKVSRAEADYRAFLEVRKAKEQAA